ncbi:MAG TPA: hypothetical protein VHP11_03810 [Tepidisphaeraceae bacterium]|nr:hypothetical protein [Tepidisphaeraceae bacterium]
MEENAPNPKRPDLIFPYINGRYFQYEDQDLVVFAFDYALTAKYRFNFAYSYDVAQERTVRSLIGLTRQFDRLFVSVSARTDRVEDETSLMVNIWPAEIQPSGSGQQLRSYFGDQSGGKR